MNIEEAGEIILAGDAWIRCWTCNGTGKHPDRNSSKEPCYVCKGEGTLGVRQDYREACMLIGREPPKRPPSRYELARQIAESLGGALLRSLSSPSIIRQVLPAQRLADVIIDDPLKRRDGE